MISRFEMHDLIEPRRLLKPGGGGGYNVYCEAAIQNNRKYTNAIIFIYIIHD